MLLPLNSHISRKQHRLRLSTIIYLLQFIWFYSIALSVGGKKSRSLRTQVFGKGLGCCGESYKLNMGRKGGLRDA